MCRADERARRDLIPDPCFLSSGLWLAWRRPTLPRLETQYHRR
jgi:hypothetical protein